MRFGLLRTISVNRLGCAKPTRLVSVAHRARRWLYRFNRIEGAVNSATLRAPPNLGRLRDVHTNSDGGEGRQTHKLLNYTAGRAYISRSRIR